MQDVRFCRSHFHDYILFDFDSIFKKDVSFGESVFCDSLYFESKVNGIAAFREVKFKYDVIFKGTRFLSQANFTEAVFEKDAWFKESLFKSDGLFNYAVFQGNAVFERIKFSDVNFYAAKFESESSFRDCFFLGAAEFIATQFGDKGQIDGKADFTQATFRGFTTFRNAHSHSMPRFTAMKGEKAFDLRTTTFELLPDFTQASFTRPPRLDNLKFGPKVEPGSFWRSIFHKTDGDVIAKYRELRRMAVEGYDHVNEQAFLKGEIRAKRGTEDRPWHAAYWMGIFYDACSDFGRSIARPFWIWVVSAAGFAALYLALSDNGIALPACAKGNPGSPVLDALYLAYKNALLVIGWESEQKLNQVHACLYGEPQAPSGIALIQLGQNLLSAAVLFVMLLGIRNRFKIK